MFRSSNSQYRSIWNRMHIDPLFMLILSILLIYSIMVIWSASGQDINILKHKISQIIIGLGTMLIISQLPPRIYENLAFCLYLLCILILICVDFFGHVTNGAQRWLDLGIIRFQPSEIAKIIVPLTISHFINRNICPPTLKNMGIALILISIPTALVAIQPDLGTAILIAISGFLALFLSGMHWKIIVIMLILISILFPVFWFSLLHEYQRHRVTMLLNSESDPLGAGYHIIQSKIAIGSGGLYGKGWLNGTQSQLAFLPEHNTDFIFSVLAEEFGFIGVLLLLMLYMMLIIRGLMIAVRAQTAFGRVLAGDLILILSIYVFINIGMVSGILPVVGVPLPLMSYGGSALVVLMAGFGMIMSIHTNRNFLSKSI